MNQKLLVVALTMPLVMLIGCGTNETRLANTEMLADEQSELNIKNTLPEISDVSIPAVEKEPSSEDLIQKDQPSEADEPITERVVEEVPVPEMLQFYFVSNDYRLSDDDLDELMVHARYLKSNPELRLKISGHTDKSGSIEYNKELSMKRADYVAKLLVEQGVIPEQISIHGAGESEVITSLEHSIRDRRVEFEYYREMQLSEKKVY